MNKQQWELKRMEDNSLPSWENKIMIDSVLIEQRLVELREEYKTATPDRKRQIVIVANRIKQSAHLYKSDPRTKTDPKLKQAVMDHLL
jgi:hypothetical protein